MNASQCYVYSYIACFVDLKSFSNTLEPVYRYSVVLINSSLLSITLYFSAKKTLVYNDKKYFLDVITEFDCTCTAHV